MKRLFTKILRQNERGVAAIEAAVVIPILIVFLALPSIYLAFYFRQYSAAQKAVHDAALYLSTAPRSEMTSAGADGSPAALTLARTIVAREMAGIVPDGTSLDVTILCEYRVSGNPALKACSTTLTKDPTHTLFKLDVSMALSYINPLTGADTGLLILPYAPVRYVGN
jgi:Flp pilus assembly protein TadG